MSMMMRQTRLVVEDYILFKVQSTNNNLSQFPDTQPTPLNIAVRSMANKYEKRYAEVFPDLLLEMRSINLDSSKIDHIFSKICRDLFHLEEVRNDGGNHSDTHLQQLAANHFDDLKWGHVMALFVFAGILSIRAVEMESIGQVDVIINWVSNFINTNLIEWLEAQGGWDNIIEWSNMNERQLQEEINQSDHPGFSSKVIGIGVIAACIGLGTIMLSRK